MGLCDLRPVEQSAHSLRLREGTRFLTADTPKISFQQQMPETDKRKILFVFYLNHPETNTQVRKWLPANTNVLFAENINPLINSCDALKSRHVKS